MKKIFNNTYFVTYIGLLVCLMMVEIIFRIILGTELLSFSTLRIFLFLNVVVAFLSIPLNLCNSIIKKIGSCIIVFGAGLYSCLQLGFLNFLGVFISVQTSSQLGAVTDYISDFLKSFEYIYLLTFIPLVLLIASFIIFRKYAKNKFRRIKFVDSLLYSLLLMIVFSAGFYFTVENKIFQNKYQAVSNKELFLTASNPSVTVDQFGSISFAFLDIKSALFPVVIEHEIEIVNENTGEINDNSRIIDDYAWNLLINEEKNKTYNLLNNYFINRKITEKNEFTGLFENKNLIVIMMESVNDIFINKEYYPNFYKMVTEGWYFENNYSPRNSCATMNNEFSGMTSLYSIYNTCTASKFKENTYYESIFNIFKRKNYITFSAHNYTQAFYPRKTIHTNMGSEEYYGVEKLKIPYSNQYINWSNDDDFMGKVLEIIDKKTKSKEHFMTWLTTVSSHQPYSSSSIQGDRYLSMTKDTKYPTDIRRYMSKLKILDEGLGILMDGLAKRGILDDTVIVLYGDHYPYGISTNHLNKVMDYNVKEDENAERVPLVIYNSKVKPTVYSQYTSYLNIVPTLANLFNLDYDPRLYLGEDLLSEDYKSITVFADGSWKNEKAFYNATKNKIKYYSSDEYTPEEVIKINEDIQNKVDISNKVIKNNYFSYLGKKLTEKQKEVDIIMNTICNIKEHEQEALKETEPKVEN